MRVRAPYLSHLHVDISGVLSEHIDSTLAAWNLQTAFAELLKALRGDHDDPAAATKQLIELNGIVRDRLQKARDLANLDREQVLTSEITAVLDEYQSKWKERSARARQTGRFRRRPRQIAGRPSRP